MTLFNATTGPSKNGHYGELLPARWFLSQSNIFPVRGIQDKIVPKGLLLRKKRFSSKRCVRPPIIGITRSSSLTGRPYKHLGYVLNMFPGQHPQYGMYKIRPSGEIGPKSGVKTVKEEVPKVRFLHLVGRREHLVESRAGLL